MLYSVLLETSSSCFEVESALAFRLQSLDGHVPSFIYHHSTTVHTKRLCDKCIITSNAYEKANKFLPTELIGMQSTSFESFH